MLNERDFWYHMEGGDKDAFRWAWRALGMEWTDPGAWMAGVGFVNHKEGGKFCAQ